MTGGHLRMPAAVAVVAAAAGFASAAHAAILPPTLGPGGCDDPTQGNADFEAYGPTDVNVQAGNGRVTVNENNAGTITVFKYPDPSLYNLVKYFAIKRNAAGQVEVQYPNEGSFAGIRWTTRAGARGFAWLSSWQRSQSYRSPDMPVPQTLYSSPAKVGLRVVNTDLAPAHGARFVRDFTVFRTPDSPVKSASLVYFANFNPVASHLPLLPVSDWCVSQLSDGSARYDAGSHSAVTSWSGTDLATGQQRTMAVAFGFAGADSAHQIGGDGYDSAALPGQPADAYDQAPTGLGGANAASGQTDAALEQPLRFARDDVATAQVTIAPGLTQQAAIARLQQSRRVSFQRQLRGERNDWHRWLSKRTLPDSNSPRVIEVAKRSLISLRLARAARTGAIVASVNTQGPYGEDWIRDGSFINRLLDDEGLHGWVTQHNLFYARIQASLAHPSLIRPPGNWTMAAYSDGVDGAPIPWEIDETGLGAWTLWDHHRYLHGKQAAHYLRRVYPAIARAANFLAFCRDPLNGLQCLANEDDSYTPSQTLHGAGPVLLGLRSAVAAAKSIGDSSAQVASWRQRITELRAAIENLYDPSSHSYAAGSGNAYNLTFADGGWLLWPVKLHPYSDPRMRGEAAAVLKAMRASLRAPRGQYEAKALLGLAHAWQPLSRHHQALLNRTLRYMASKLTTPTGLFGESWERHPNGRPFPVQDMPHVWEHTLFLMAALETDGARPYCFNSC